MVECICLVGVLEWVLLGGENCFLPKPTFCEENKDESWLKMRNDTFALSPLHISLLFFFFFLLFFFFFKLTCSIFFLIN